MRGSGPHRRELLVGAAAALVTAALIVVYLQRRSVERQEQQTTLAVQQVCEQTAMVLAARVRELFGAAVFETLEGITHPELRAFDLRRIALAFQAGHKRHVYVDRFFTWRKKEQGYFAGEMLFYRQPSRLQPDDVVIAGEDGEALGGLYVDRSLGAVILRLAATFVREQRSFVVAERTIADQDYQIILHYLWDDDRRHDYTAVVGYVVNLAEVRRELFSRLQEPEVRRILNPDPTFPRLSLTVQDEQGALVHGSPVIDGVPRARASIDLVFFPVDSLKPWLAAQPLGRRWSLVVSPASPVTTRAVFSYWLLGAVVFLIIIAMFCAVTLDHQEQQLLQMQTDFVANVSHQLKTPLSLLAAASETLDLERVRSPEKTRQYAGIVRTQTARLSGLVEQILHFSRSETANGSYRFTPLNLVPLVRDSVNGFGASASGDVTFQFEHHGEVVPVRGDPTAIEQVVVNLLENSVKYGNGHNRVTVRVEANNGEAVIIVRDRGTGIDRTDLPRIFDKFYRGQNSRSQRGFGLGLALVRAITQAHQGRVSVESDPRLGTEFRVFMPTISEDAVS